MNSKRSLLLCLLVGTLILDGRWQPDASADQTAPEETLVYEVRYGSLLAGQLTRTLQVNGEHYSLRSELEPAGFARWLGDDRLVEISRGLLREGVVEPREYQFRDDRKQRDYRYQFDPLHSHVQDTHPDPDIAMQPRLLDEVNVLHALRNALREGATLFEAPVVNGAKGRAYEHRYRVSGRETVEVPAGRFTAVKVIRETSRGKYRMTFWCSKALDYAPVQVSRIDPKGREVTMVLISRRSAPST